MEIGTAGSVPLLFDAVVPLATVLEASLSVTATGGTDVTRSPTAAHYRRTKLRLLRRYGLGAAVEVDRPGFYSAGGGQATLRLFPSSLSRLELAERGTLEGSRVDSLAAEALAGGRLRIPAPTAHVESGHRLLEAFGHDLSVLEREGSVLVSA